jgi:GcrA cell cycle regulator
MSARTLLQPRDHGQITLDLPAPTRDEPRPCERTKQPSGRSETWTTERVAQLRICAEAGWTCSRIAAEIGVSRNAVIGKMSRLGLSRRKKAQARAPEAAPKRPRWRTPNLARILARYQIMGELATVSPNSAGAIAILNGRGCSLLELAPGKCRWPINEPGAADFCFCGSAQIDGLPYCPGHARLAYKSTAGSA